jgi:peptide/nickel transport system permease protein
MKPLAKYLARRFAASILLLLGVVTITFCLIFIFPADPAVQIAGPHATPEVVASIRHQKHLDEPLYVQYAYYVGGLLRGDLGQSFKQRTQVAELVWSRLPATLLLMLGAIFFELLIGIPLGILAAARRGKIDRGIMIVAFAGVSAPQFVVGLILLYVFAYVFGWFPLSGYGGLSHLILPALTLGIGGGGWYARVLRSNLVEVMRQDYIRTARHGGPRYRDLHGWRSRGRDRLWLARHRPTRLAGDPAGRYTHHHGRHAGRGRSHRHRQPAGRSGDSLD